MDKYIIGIDGGGSKTAFMLSDTEKKPISEIKLSRSNPNDIGIESTISLILEGMRTLCVQAEVRPEQIAAVYAGIAGVTACDFKNRIKNAVDTFYKNAVTLVNHDGVNILYAAFPDKDGAGVISGTGTSCFVKKNDVLYRIGGYGLFDLAGGGYEIGRAAISHALRTIDGRDEESVLSDLIKSKAGFDLIEGLGDLISSGKNNIATYAPLVFEAFERNDSYAVSILNIHTSYLAELINTAKKFFDGPFEASIAGGIGKDPITLKILRPMLKDGITVTPLECEPIFGAVARAKVLLTKGI